ncbi:helix-turn-helix domain-containing protein [Kribbella sp. NPDC049174]|uniref:helix-turn-helix domain-containing protein n=1 Tax=Kribbella sp. NPDC049174 TaxID=3364112 RepID=UPI00371B311C
MTTQSATGTVSRIQLGRHLRELREGARISLREAGRRLELSAATVSRMENGETSVRSLDVEQACKIYGVSDPEVVRSLMDLALETKAKSWLQSYADVVSDNFAMYVGFEAAASALAWYEPDFVPGLLQTHDYARSVMELERFTGKQPAPDLMERRLDFRLDRQQILRRESGAPELTVVVGEAALRRSIGGAETMAGQLAHLLEITHLTNIELRVMPLDREHGGLTTGQFIVLDFPSRGNGRLIEPPGVYVDGYLGFHYTVKPDEVELYRTAWSTVWDTAYDAEQSADFISHRLEELQQRT